MVALGATAAQSLIGRAVTIGKERGRFQPYPPERHLFVTVHPSYLLRLPDERAKAVEYRRFVDELGLIAAGPATGTPRAGPPGVAVLATSARSPGGDKAGAGFG